ncbi:PAAR domain-containing protein [Kitasatospora sp. NPDC049285]|uniref:PAAR domain-containing protein n=1 Tax=Kitasatospora sp. NPDC049285 TaxID=3157096 RepID=UPI003444881F
MAEPAAVSGDRVTGVCTLHLVPNPATGAPQPAPPLPFAAPITLGVCPTVLIGGRPAVVVGATGLNTPPHVGLHPADPFLAPPTQQAVITSGSGTVLFGGVPAARTGSPATCCGQPVGQLTGSAATVLIGG